MRPKAFLDPEHADLQLDFVLAEKLGCTVAELRERMSAMEWMQWGRYLAVKAQTRELEAKAAAARMGR